MKTLGAFVLILAIVIGAIFYRPLSVKNATWGIRFELAKNKLLFMTCKVGEFVGLQPYMICFRELRNSLMRVSNASDVMVTQEYFGGVRSLLYQPKFTSEEDAKGRAALVYLHRGGWVLGLPESGHVLNLDLVRRLNIVIVAFDYRKGPDHLFPKAFDDCLAGILAFAESAPKLGVDPKRIGVYGDSAGGNLAAAVAGHLHGGGVPESKFRIAQLFLFNPVLQALDFTLPSYIENAHEDRLTRELMLDFWQLYLLGRQSHTAHLLINNHTNFELRQKAKELMWDHLSERPTPPRWQGIGNPEAIKAMQSATSDPLASPILFSDSVLTKLPPVYLVTCQFDVLRDEGIALVRRLQRLRHQVTHEHYNFYHSVLAFCKYHHPTVVQAVKDFVNYLGEHL